MNNNINALFQDALDKTWSLFHCFNLTSSRPMTAGEISLAQTVFGNDIDFSRVRIRPDRSEDANFRTGACSGNNIYISAFSRSMVITDDFSKATKNPEMDIERLVLFFHELTHVWQYQNTPYWRNFKAGLLVNLSRAEENVYDYDIKDSKKMSDLGIEQQAQLVEDYVKSIIVLTPAVGKDVQIQGLNAGQFSGLAKQKIESSLPLNTRQFSRLLQQSLG